MAVVAVTFNGTRVDDSDANTDWDNYNVGGGSPASEFPLAYQVTSGTTSGAVNRKVNSSAARQGVERYNATGDDMTGTNKLWFCKVYIADAFDLNATWGVEVNMGSADDSNKHIYNIAGTGANLSVYDIYPAQGGYLITSIDPSIDTWAETADSGGAFDQTDVRFYAVGAQFINGTAKTENVAMDSIDIGKGLNLVGGDGADPDGDFTFFVAEDQDDKTNRWGVVTGGGNNVRANGMLVIGENNSATATATVFNDTTSVVSFPDGYHSRGTVGVEVELGNATTDVTIDSLLIGEGTRNGVDANDTRPDFLVTGTSGSLALGAQLRNFRDVTLTSACALDGADVECHLLTQASADIENSVIRTNALTNEACLQDPTFGTTTDLNNTEFVQTGVGHAIELGTATTYDFQDITFTGYGGTPGTNLVGNSGAADAAIVNTSNGSITVNINGSGNQPSVRNVGASSETTIAQTVTCTVTCVDSDGNPIENARVLLNTASDTIIDAVLTNASGQASASFAGTTPVAIDTANSRARKSSASPYYKSTPIQGTITSSGFDVTLLMQDDE